MKLTHNTLAAAALTLLPAAAAQAQSLSPAQQEQVIANFVQADGNRDGALNRNEFETLINLNANDGLGKAGLVRRTGAYGAVFARLDADGDGLVTPVEVKALAEQVRG